MESSSVLKLLEASLVVARLGEADVHNWWQTDGLLGEDGAFVGPRVLPKTHSTARARIVFAVAARGCLDRHPDKSARSLFRLGPVTADLLDVALVAQLGESAWWSSWMEKLQSVGKASSVGGVLTDLGIVSSSELDEVASLPLGPDGRSLPLPDSADPQRAIRLLAAGFSRSEPGQLAVPFMPAGSELLA